MTDDVGDCIVTSEMPGEAKGIPRLDELRALQPFSVHGGRFRSDEGGLKPKT